MPPSMRPFSLLPLLAESLLDNDLGDLLLLSFLASMEEEEEAFEEESSLEEDWEDDDDDDDDDEDEEEEEDSEYEFEDSDDDDDDDDDDETADGEPGLPKRRRLNNSVPQESGAGTSSGTVPIPIPVAILRQPGSSSLPGPTTSRTNTLTSAVYLRRIPQALLTSQRSVQSQSASEINSSPPRMVPVHRPNLHSRSQQVQTDAQENGSPRVVDIREVSRHNLPHNRAVLWLPSVISDVYPREE